jgi:HD-GYP domain-containing protein (c-di-GMP phosphodiesterase class II)
LFAVVDVWDALRSNRPYRKSMPQEEVIEYIMSCSGSHFDPKVVALFLVMLSEEKQKL